MRRIVALGLVVVAVACTGGGDETADPPEPAARRSEDPARDMAVDIVTGELLAVPRADLQDDDEARCIAEQIVEDIGVERLGEVGLDLEAANPPRLWHPELTEAEGDEVFAAYDGCLDFEQRDIEAFMADGLTEAEARCVSRGYRESGIPRVHSLEPPHSMDMTPDRLAAHEDLDILLAAMQQACRDWIDE